MKDTKFDYKEETKKENIVYHFQPTQRLDAIKTVIIDRCKQKRQSTPPIEHIGGLPSPPVEEKKPVLEEEEEELLSCQDIQTKIDLLKEEKHRLFQRIKLMMLQEKKLVRPDQEKVQETKVQRKRWESLEKPNYFYSRPRYNNLYNTPPQHRASRPYSRPPYSR